MKSLHIYKQHINIRMFGSNKYDINTTPNQFIRNIFMDDCIPNNIDDDILNTIMEQQNKSGFIPNIFLVLLQRPNEFRSFFSYYNAIMKERNSELSIEQKEMIVVCTSAYNQCLYCVVAHGGMLRVFSKKYNDINGYDYQTISDQIAIDYKKANISDKDKIMLDYAVKLSQTPSLISDNDIQILLDNGFTKNAIWDIGSITSFFSMSNRLAHHTGLMPNNQFYDMCRHKNE